MKHCASRQLGIAKKLSRHDVMGPSAFPALLAIPDQTRIIGTVVHHSKKIASVALYSQGIKLPWSEILDFPSFPSRFVRIAVGASLGALVFSASALAQTPNRSVANPALFNVLNQPLLACSHAPLTGYLRNGSCAVSAQDAGVHGVCAVMSAKFLAFTKAQGNDLSTPNPALHFPGLKPGDHWCVCAGRWQQALDGGAAPKVVLAATSKEVLSSLFLDDLAKYAVDAPAHLPPPQMP